MSRTGSRWFLRFVTIASWPIFAGVLLAVMVALGGQGAMARSYLECLVAALVLLVTALSTPVLASHVVGGALQNFAGAGFASAKGLGTDGVVPAARVASGAKGVALHVVQGLGGGPGSGGQNPPGGGAAAWRQRRCLPRTRLRPRVLAARAGQVEASDPDRGDPGLRKEATAREGEVRDSWKRGRS